jgi:hypothetical protein
MLASPVLVENSLAAHRNFVSAETPRPVYHDGAVVMQVVGDAGGDPAENFLEYYQLELEAAEFQYSVLNFNVQDPAGRHVEDAGFADFAAFGPGSFEKLRPCAECHHQLLAFATTSTTGASRESSERSARIEAL